MLIGLGEPFMDPKIFDRIEYCQRHSVSTLLSTNGTCYWTRPSAKLLASSLEHITLSFDGATKESFEFYRKGARFEKVRDNFVRFARMKNERGSKMQVVVQMVRMEGTRRGRRFRGFWSAVPGVDQVRVKADETNLLQPGGRRVEESMQPCHYLWRGPMYVKHNGDVYPCCQSYMLDGSAGGARGRAVRWRRFEFPPRCSACGDCTLAVAPAKSTSARAVASPFRIPCWSRVAWCFMGGGCGG